MSSRTSKSMFLVLLVLIIGVFVGSVQAKNVCGTTGLINIPTASVRASGSMNLAYNWFKKGHYTSIVLGVFPGVEVGLAGRLDNSNELILIGNLKVKLLEETAEYPGIAAGLRAGMGDVSYYIVGSMQIGMPGVRAHAGIGTGEFSNPFAGISTVLNPVSVSAVDKEFNVPLTTLTCEWDGSSIHAGVLLKFKNQLEGRLTITDFAKIGVGVNYTYSF